ncbi:alpha/beta hydrolase [Oerskovia sp. M15]
MGGPHPRPPRRRHGHARPQGEAPLPDGAAPATDTQTSPSAGDTRPGGGLRRRAVLYVHGFVDYFFQAHLGDAFEEHGYAFYAIDLRGYGRSLAHWTEAARTPT